MAQISAYSFADDGSIPNHPKWPMLVYKGAFAAVSGDHAIGIETAFHANGWGNSWRNGIYPFPHYHSNAHEVLGIASGSATVRFGGEVGGVFEVETGDVALLPAEHVEHDTVHVVQCAVQQAHLHHDRLLRGASVWEDP